MIAPRARSPALGAACALLLLAIAPGAGERASADQETATRGRRPATTADRPRGRQPPAAAQPATVKPPRAFLIYLLDGVDPIIVKRYVEENDQIRFEKYGGWVGIPRYEILKIVPDEPDTTPDALPPPIPSPAQDAVAAAPPPARDVLYVTMRGGVNVKATGVAAEGDRVRVSTSDGSFTLPRSHLIAVVRVPSGRGTPEAWVSVQTTEPAHLGAAASPGAGIAVPPTPATAPLPDRVPYPSSGRPHLLRLGNGRLIRVEGFWIEDGQIRFRRLGGMVGIALSEVLRLIPEELAPVHGRTPVRFARRLGPDLLEVRVPTGVQRVRLIGVEPVAEARTGEDPWTLLKLGLVIYLEFDRQRYDPRGDWLVYVFLPNGRMLNAELIRLGLARPRPDARNVRYLDLFHELAPDALANRSGAPAASP